MLLIDSSKSSTSRSYSMSAHQKFILMKTSSRRLDKTNVFILLIHLQKTSSSHLWDVLIKTNILVLGLLLQDVFKTFWKRLQDLLQRLLQDVLKTSLRHVKDLAKTSSRHLQNVFKTSCKTFFKTSSRSLQDALKMSSRRLQDIFKTFCIYKGAFLAKMLNTFKLLTVFKKKAWLQMFDWVVSVWLRVWNIELTLVPSL